MLKSQPFPTTAFRLLAVIGPDDPAMLTHFKMVNRDFAPLPSGKVQLLSYIYVDDLVEAIYIMSKERNEEHKLYFATADDLITNHDIIREIAAFLEKKALIVLITKGLIWLNKVFFTDYRMCSGLSIFMINGNIRK